MAQYEALPQSIGARPELISAGLLGSLAAADRPPDVRGLLQVSDWPKELGKSLANLPGMIREQQAFQTQLPVMKAKAQTELLQQQAAQRLLHNALYPGQTENLGNLPYQTGIGPNAGVTVSPYPPYLPGPTVNNPPGKDSGASDQSFDQTNQTSGDQSSAPAQTGTPGAITSPEDVRSAPTQNPANIGGVSIPYNPQGTISNPNAVQGQGPWASATPSPAASLTAGTITPSQIRAQGGPLQASTAPGPLPEKSDIPSPSTPSPVDAANSLASRTHVTPEEALAWYQQNVSTDAAHARQEFDPQTGQATNRIIISHKPPGKGQPAKPDQPVHAQYILNNPGAGGWMHPMSGQPNPSLAASPAQALSAAAAAPVAQNIQQTIEQGAGLPASVSPLVLAGGATAPRAVVGPPNVQPAPIPPTMANAINNPLAAGLASGTLTPAQIIAQGGPLTASSARGPGPMPTPYQLTMGSQAPTLAQPAFNAPVAASVPTPAGTQEPTPEEQLNSHPDVRPYDPDKWGQKDDIYARVLENAVKHPKDISITGTATNSPSASPTERSSTASFPYYGQNFPGYVDAKGMPYMVLASEPFGEQRLYWSPNGPQVIHVQNTIGQAEDKEMMEASMKAGTFAGGGWDSIPPAEKIARYRLAQTYNNYPVNDAATERESKLLDVMNQGKDFLDHVDAYEKSHPNDPGASGLRSIGSEKTSDLKDTIGTSVKGVTGIETGLRGDPQLMDMRNAYDKFLTAARAAQAADLPTRGSQPTIDPSKVRVPGVGDFNESTLPNQVRDYLKTTGLRLRNQIDTMNANHQRVLPDSVFAADQVTLGPRTPGGEQAPLPANPQSYDKLPMNAYYQWQGIDPRTGKPWPIMQKKFKTLEEAQKAKNATPAPTQ